MTDGPLRIVTIDGPAGSGKSTIGQKLALKLKWKFLDSGALYRCCAYIKNTDSLTDSELIDHLTQIEFLSIPQINGSEAKIILNGEDLSIKIRTSKCAKLASQLAANPQIRQHLLTVQRNYYSAQGLVADGRDMGSVVFPDAMLKIYLTASLKARAERKYKQLSDLGVNTNYQKIYYGIEKRDHRDSTRKHAPLTTPDNAFVLDTSDLNSEEVLSQLLEAVESATNDARCWHTA